MRYEEQRLLLDIVAALVMFFLLGLIAGHWIWA